MSRTFQPVTTTNRRTSAQLAGLIPDPTGRWLKVAAMAGGAAAGAYYLGAVKRSYAPAGAALAVPVAFVVAAYVFD